ncbi:MAG: polyketide synthase, partial [Rubripirellula sp.]
MRSDEQIAPELSTLLSSLRKRIRRFVFIDSTLAIIGLLLGSFWIGLLIDHTPVRFGGTEMPWLARFLFLALSVTSLLWLTIKMLVARLLRPLPNPSLALLIERQHPELGGRLTTAVELLAADRPIEDHSRLLLAKVHLQAAKLIRDIDPSRLFKRETLIKKSLVTAPLSIAAIVLFILDPNSFALAAKRLTLLSNAPWPRRADLEMVGIETPVIRASEENSDQTELIEFENQLVRLPIGSSSTLRIRARANDAELPPVCTVFYETDAGSVGQSNMRRVGRVTDDFQYFVLDGPPLTDLNESLTLSVRGLDDRLDNFRIEAVQPPTISDANVAVTFPNYLKVSDTGNPDWSRSYQTGIRVEEGSDVELVIRSTSTLGSVDLAIQGNTSVNQASSRSSEIKIAADGLSASLKIEGVQTATTISMVPRDTDRISAQAPYRYLIGVIKDEPPEMTLALKGIGNAITANAKLPMTTTISDDYGANRSSVNLVVSKNTDAPPTNDEPESEPIKNGETQDTNPTSLAIPDGSGETALIADLRELIASKELPQLSPGFEIDLIGETHDRYDLGSEHTTLTQVIRLPVVTPETLLAFLER